MCVPEPEILLWTWVCHGLEIEMWMRSRRARVREQSYRICIVELGPALISTGYLGHTLAPKSASQARFSMTLGRSRCYAHSSVKCGVRCMEKEWGLESHSPVICCTQLARDSDPGKHAG
ncbi:hypothetical protein KC344_g148 [Hortaea werneckii]|nr:hypothetical protein KC344_g148 [Hortaea werneckii]